MSAETNTLGSITIRCGITRCGAVTSRSGSSSALDAHRGALGSDDLFGLVVGQTVLASPEQLREHTGSCLLQYGSGEHSLAGQTETPGNVDADFFVCPENTAHLALESAGTPLALPGLHIAEVLAEQAARDRRHRVGILATKYTMDSDLYLRALARHGIDTAIPDDDDRHVVNNIIFGELAEGIFTDQARATYVQIIRKLRERDCDAVALACTEIPLLIDAQSSPLPVLDSTRLLATAAFDVAVGHRPLPSWHGGATM